MTGALVSKALIWSNDSPPLEPHSQALPVRVSSNKGLDTLEKTGINLVQNGADTRELLTSDWFCGLGALTMASNLFLETCSPSPVSTSPILVMLFASITYLSHLRVRPLSSNFRALLCQSFRHAISHHHQLLSHRDVSCGHQDSPAWFAISIAETSQCTIWSRKTGDVRYDESGWSSIWWNAMFRSTLLKTFAPDISCKVSSLVGTGCFSLGTARFPCLMSKQIRMSPLRFSTTTRGLIVLVGPLTFSTTLGSSSCFSFSDTFSLSCWMEFGVLAVPPEQCFRPSANLADNL